MNGFFSHISNISNEFKLVRHAIAMEADLFSNYQVIIIANTFKIHLNICKLIYVNKIMMVCLETKQNFMG